MSLNKSKIKTAAQLKQFGYVMALALSLVTFFLFYRGLDAGFYTATLVAIFVVASVFDPLSLLRVEIVWMRIGMAMGVVVTHILLTLMFVFVITPIGVSMRLFGKKLLDLEVDKKCASYWKKVETEGAESRYFLPY